MTAQNAAHQSPGGWVPPPRHYLEFSEPATLRRQICRGLASIEEAAAEAKRRNREVTRCLAEVQADITRITERMCRVRQQRRQRPCYEGGDLQGTTGASPGASSSRVGAGRHAWSERNEHSSSRPRTHDGSRFCEASPPFATAGRRGSEGCDHTASRPSTQEGRRRVPQPPPVPPHSAPGRMRAGKGHRPESVLRGGSRSQGTQAPKPSKGPEAPCARAAEAGFVFGASAPQGAPARPQRSAPADDPLALEPPEGQALRVRQAVRGELLQACRHSEAEQRALVKRLLVKWHPDRNPGSVELATSVFQYIQQEKEQLLGL